MNVHDTLIHNIKKLASSKGLSVNRLADFAGLSRGYMSTLLRGQNSPTVATLEKIADVLEVEVRDLFEPRETE